LLAAARHRAHDTAVPSVLSMIATPGVGTGERRLPGQKAVYRYIDKNQLHYARLAPILFVNGHDLCE
jgi:hypothetical protein